MVEWFTFKPHLFWARTQFALKPHPLCANYFILKDREVRQVAFFSFKVGHNNNMTLRLTESLHEIDASSHHKHGTHKQHYYGGVALTLTCSHFVGSPLDHENHKNITPQKIPAIIR